MDELRDKIKKKQIIIGTDKVLKYLKIGKLAKIYLSSNCPKNTLSDVEHYAKLHNIKVEISDKTNEELGVLCKKPFSISVLAY